MLKKLLIVSVILLPCVCAAQSDTSPVVMQMRNGKIYFDNTYALDAGLKKDMLYDKALSWFKRSFPYPEKTIDISDNKNGEIDGAGIFKIATSSSGHYYWMKFTINITVRNATYELKAFDFYEKPIEPGISNEYSKIEYRWRDYRQGKPWSAEDETLFKGFRAAINDMMASLEKDLSK